MGEPPTGRPRPRSVTARLDVLVMRKLVRPGNQNLRWSTVRTRFQAWRARTRWTASAAGTDFPAVRQKDVICLLDSANLQPAEGRLSVKARSGPECLVRVSLRHRYWHSWRVQFRRGSWPSPRRS